MLRAFFGMLAVALGGAALSASAQVEVTARLVHDRTILMEPVQVNVGIANYTGRDLDLTARGNARLTFDVEDQPTSTLPASGSLLGNQPVIIPAGDTREVEVNLLDAYRLVKGQTYMLTPVLEFEGVRFLGPRLSIEVQPGLAVLQRDFGMPGSDQMRTAFLRLIHRDRADRLFFRLDNPATGYCLGTYDLGRVIRFFPPRLAQDRENRFHVLHQTGPDRFAHSIFDYDGGPAGTTFYAAESGGIRLQRTEAGAIEVAGGIRYEEDPENPGLLTAPALPPSHPYNMNLAEPAAKGPPATTGVARPAKVE
jgi:hypothetical protein